MKTIALCLIVKNEEAERKLAYEAIKPLLEYVDNVYITLNGKEDSSPLPDNRDKVKFSYCKWEDNFSKVRNFNFSQAKEDWILWIDTDDGVINPEKLRDIIDEAEKNKVSGLYMKYLYEYNGRGELVMWHWKMRLVKNPRGSTYAKWLGKIHEDFLPTENSMGFTWVREDRVMIKHKNTGERKKESSLRNLRLLQKEYDDSKESPDPRIIIYLARAKMMLGLNDEAAPLLHEFTQRSGWDEERYEAYQMLGDIALGTKDHEASREWYLLSLKEKPEYRTAYVNIAKTYFAQEEWGKCIEWCELGFSRKTQDGLTGNFPLLDYVMPAKMYAQSLVESGKLEQAVGYLSKMMKAYPGDENISDLYDMAAHILWDKQAISWITRIIAEMKDTDEKHKIPWLVQAIPNRLQDNPITSKFKMDFMPPKKWSEKSIVFVCGFSVEQWSPLSIDRGGIGGSETAIVHLARGLVKLGWEVTVFGNPQHETGVYDGVEYRNFWDLRNNDQFNVVVMWRSVGLLHYGFKAKKLILDLHDVPEKEQFTDKIITSVDKIMVKSEYHRSLLPSVPDEKFVVVPNGIDPSRFEGWVNERIPHSVIYSSTPNRGLDTLLGVWPKVREKYPDATLRIFYGWKTFYELEKNNPTSIKWMRKIQDKVVSMKKDGVIDMGRVGQRELSEWQKKSSVWAYPTAFPEIHCITAVEAQAAGTIPVTTTYAALKETVKYGYLINGYIHESKDEFTDKLIQALGDETFDRNQMSVWAIRQYAWESITKQWDKALRS